MWYRHRGQRPSKSDIIRDDANKASTLPSSFEVVGVKYGRRLDETTVDSNQFALRVEPPSDNISQDAVDAIAQAFEDNWGGTIEHVETIQS
jgi:uncharacterized protein (UPF0218 family)